MSRAGRLPGFGLTLGFTLVYLGLIVALPLSTLFTGAASFSLGGLHAALLSPRVLAAFRLSVGASLAAALVTAVFGFLVAWVLVRYRFPGRTAIDALVDLPFALPTAVGGIALTALWAESGWLGRHAAAAGIKVAFTPLGVVVALVFIGFPFVVRMVQPVLQDLDPALEEAAASLGAGRLQTFRRVILPHAAPAIASGATRERSRGMSIEVRGVTKIYEAAAVLHGVDLQVGSGELVALLGPSGCGKTTLLRIIAGLEAPDAGSVRVSGEDTASLAARERRVGFVFQHYALFRRMSVFDNVAFGLQVRPRLERPPREAIRARVLELLRLVQLERYADRTPGQLSGGQQQRVALARALAVEPDVLLLDEPFGSLDARVRRELRLWLRRLHDELHVTSVFVTHDQEEALEVADRVVLMNAGRIEQAGTPQEVWEHPATPFVLDFLGGVNLFRGRVHRGRLSIGDWQVDVPEHAGTHASAAVGYVRAHELEVARAGGEEAGLAASILAVRRLGPTVRIEMRRLDTEGTFEASLSAERFAALDLRPGETVFARPTRVRVFVDPPERPEKPRLT